MRQTTTLYDLENNIANTESSENITHKPIYLSSSLKSDEDFPVPYHNAVEVLKCLDNYHSPIDKMRLISKIPDQITLSVNDYWKDLKTVITKSLLNIDADELMSIFIFIVIQSQFPEILIHNEIIKNFTTCSTKNSMDGYYYVTLEASILYITELKDKNILKDYKKVFRSSSLPCKTNNDNLEIDW
jgi:hypothetical protein